jgi:cytochrome c peroxidase
MRLGSAIAVALLCLPIAGPAQAEPAAVDAAALARIAQPPLGLPPVPLPADNPPSAAKIALGRKLFFDRRLSFNGTMSCAMCHVPEQGFTNNELATPIGVEGRGLRRNAPTVLNVAYQQLLFHDGRETALETQVIGPLLALDEMANPSIGYVIAKIAALSDYAGLFERAFGAGPAIGRLGQAVASWERSLLAADAPFDRWHYGGEAAALSERQRRGFALFVGISPCSSARPAAWRATRSARTRRCSWTGLSTTLASAIAPTRWRRAPPRPCRSRSRRGARSCSTGMPWRASACRPRPTLAATRSHSIRPTSGASRRRACATSR